MKTIKGNSIKCSRCGRFIAFKDFDDGKAVRFQTVPDSMYSVEEWENYCYKCWKKEHEDDAK